jgi:hypothetical protein
VRPLHLAFKSITGQTSLRWSVYVCVYRWCDRSKQASQQAESFKPPKYSTHQSKIHNSSSRLTTLSLTQTVASGPGSKPPATPGAGPSKSTVSTPLLASADSLTRFPKYFLATSDSILTLPTSALRWARDSTDRWSPTRRLSAGKRRILRTSVDMR